MTQRADRAAGSADTHFSRESLLKEAAQLITDDAASLWLVVVKQVAGMTKKVHDPLFLRTGTLTINEATWIES